MSMITHKTRAFGAPSRYIQGQYELDQLKEYTDAYGDKVLILADAFFYDDYAPKFEAMYAEGESEVVVRKFSGEITAEKIDELAEEFKEFSPNVVAGMGGGKTMDTAKAVSDKFHAATVIIPTTASTDAPVIGLSVIYTDNGEHVGARHYIKNPDLVLLDTDIISKAPVRFFSAGMGDALATYVETRANLESHSPNYVGKGFCTSIAAAAIAEACHATILQKGRSAKLAAEKGLCTADVEDVIEANTLLSGLGVQNSSCAGAHSIAEGITVLPACKKLLHGEAVAFGILVQLIIEGRPSGEVNEIYEFLAAVDLPFTFEMLGIKDASEEEIMRAAKESLKSYWDVEPFPVTAQMIYDAMVMADLMGSKYQRI